MTPYGSILLNVAGMASLAIAVLQFVMYFGGPAVYRYCGTPEPLIRLRVRHPGFVFLVECALFVLFSVFAAYAFSGSELIGPLPWRARGLAVIALVYLLRGALVVVQFTGRITLSGPRDILYSVFALLIGLAYAIPVWRHWAALQG